MLKYPELAMNPNKEVVTICKRKKIVWDDREEAKEYFLEAMISADEEEHDRYECVFIQIMNGLDYCSDEDDDK